MPQDAAQREIDEALLEVSDELAIEELGGRRRIVWKRNRLDRAGQDLLLGTPGYTDRPWAKIDPTPQTDDINREFDIQTLGLVEIGDIEMRVDRLAVSRIELTESEYYINDDPDASDPTCETPSNYDLLAGKVLEGGGGIRDRYNSSWICFLRKRQSSN